MRNTLRSKPKAEGGEIHWGDEPALVNTGMCGRGYATARQTPVTIAVRGTHHMPSMIATVTNLCKMRWMIIDESFNGQQQLEFLQSLIKRAKNRVFQIFGSLWVHYRKLVKVWLAEQKHQIEVLYQTNYSPALHPEERLNADLEQAAGLPGSYAQTQ